MIITNSEIWKNREAGNELYAVAKWNGSGGEFAGPYILDGWFTQREEAEASAATYQKDLPHHDGWNAMIGVISHSNYADK